MCDIGGAGDSIHIFSSMNEKYSKTAQGNCNASILRWTDRALSKLEGVNDILLICDPDTFAACNLQKLCPGNLDKCS